MRNNQGALFAGKPIGAFCDFYRGKYREANYAHGRPDFIAKLQIALKECYETEYWLELFEKSDIVNRGAVADLCTQCGTIRRLLIASINTAKGNHNDK